MREFMTNKYRDFDENIFRPIETVESDTESVADKMENKEKEEESGIVSESVSASSVILMFGGTGKFKKTPGAANKESEEGKNKNKHFHDKYSVTTKINISLYLQAKLRILKSPMNRFSSQPKSCLQSRKYQHHLRRVPNPLEKSPNLLRKALWIQKLTEKHQILENPAKRLETIMSSRPV